MKSMSLVFPLAPLLGKTGMTPTRASRTWRWSTGASDRAYARHGDVHSNERENVREPREVEEARTLGVIDTDGAGFALPLEPLSLRRRRPCCPGKPDGSGVKASPRSSRSKATRLGPRACVAPVSIMVENLINCVAVVVKVTRFTHRLFDLHTIFVVTGRSFGTWDWRRRYFRVGPGRGR